MSLMSVIKNYYNLVKFSHTIFALPFAFIGFFIGVQDNWNNNSLIILGLMVLCMIFARNAAMGFNRYTDRRIDSLNPRTQNREIPNKKVKPHAALTFTVINAVLFIIVTFFINPLSFFLSPVALVVILGYSYSKRFTNLSHFILGISLALAPIGAYIAIAGQFALLPILISFVVLFWVSGFDILYAIQDIEFDKKFRLKSIPAKMGINNAKIISLITHFISIIIIIIIGLTHDFGYFFWMASLFFGTFVLYQHYSIYKYGFKAINNVFFLYNGLASILFTIFTCIDLYFKV